MEVCSDGHDALIGATSSAACGQARLFYRDARPIAIGIESDRDGNRIPLRFPGMGEVCQTRIEHLLLGIPIVEVAGLPDRETPAGTPIVFYPADSSSEGNTRAVSSMFRVGRFVQQGVENLVGRCVVVALARP
jgi:hypothetical protein